MLIVIPLLALGCLKCASKFYFSFILIVELEISIPCMVDFMKYELLFHGRCHSFLVLLSSLTAYDRVKLDMSGCEFVSFSRDRLTRLSAEKI